MSYLNCSRCNKVGCDPQLGQFAGEFPTLMLMRDHPKPSYHRARLITVSVHNPLTFLSKKIKMLNISCLACFTPVFKSLFVKRFGNSDGAEILKPIHKAQGAAFDGIFGILKINGQILSHQVKISDTVCLFGMFVCGPKQHATSHHIPYQ